MIKLQEITKSYFTGEQAQTVLHPLNLEITAGELVAIMGASGSGKSTLMNILGLLDHPSSGHYYLKDREVASLGDDERAGIRNRSIGFVFQSFFLLPRLTAVKNIGLPLIYRGLTVAEIDQRATAMLARVGLSNRAQHLPNQLSGGQQQRVAIGRALVVEPDIILADEPTGALDSKTGQSIMDLFIELNHTENTTIIIVTHDNKIASQCQRVIEIADGIITG